MAYRSLMLILVSAMVLVALGACQDRRSLRQQEGATLLPRSQDTPEIQTTPVPMPSGREGGEQVNRIAYVGSDGNIFTIRPDGTDSRRLTTTDLRVGPGGHIFVQAARSQVFYAWPTWSPDSTKLAVSRSSVQGNSGPFLH